MSHNQDERLAISQNEQIQKIDLSKIKANPYQPRKTFDDDRLSDLAMSIQTHGVLQPIVLRQTVQGYYIVVGERRFDMMELAIIENLQREDLNAIEEAESYQRLMNDLGLTQQKVAERLGKSRPYIANMLRLLNLPKDISNQVKEGALSSAHGRTLLGIKDVTMMKKISQQAIRENWSVRYLEQVVNELQDGGQSKKSKATTQITNYQ